MVTITTKNIILIWIIILILFTFYCVFRLKYMNANSKYNYFDNTSQTPIINYINDIQKQSKLTDMKSPEQCKNLFDDNIKIQKLGYTNCESAFADYLAKGFDVNNNFGETQSLAEICPIASKSPLYEQCLTSLLTKFANTSDIVSNISADMTNSINKRLEYRTSTLDNIQNQMNPFIFNKDQNNFNKYMKENNSVANYKADVLGLVDNYYQDRYRGGIGSIDGNIAEGFVGRTSVYIIDPAIIKMFFGNYKPINGQFLALNDLTLFLGYDTNNLLTPNYKSSNLKPVTTTQAQSNQSNQSNQSSQSNQMKDIILIISSKSNNLQIIYKIVTIDNYKNTPNTVKLVLSSKEIISDTNDAGTSQTIQNLLFTLGITSPTQLIITYEEFTSSENVLNKTYKLLNDNLDTVLVLNKF